VSGWRAWVARGSGFCDIVGTPYICCQ